MHNANFLLRSSKLNMVEGYAVARLRNELRELSQNEDSGFSVGLKNDDWFEWTVSFPGPEDTAYEGGFYLAVLKFPTDYPNSPPQMTFETEMWHPNIFPDRRVCISILHPPGEDVFNPAESSAERWRPILGVEAILVSVISMLNDPNLDSPANLDAAKQYREDRQGYLRRVRRLAQKSVENL
jgi:ubiquitin-conjugating enzyme E2 G1